MRSGPVRAHAPCPSPPWLLQPLSSRRPDDAPPLSSAPASSATSRTTASACHSRLASSPARPRPGSRPSRATRSQSRMARAGPLSSARRSPACRSPSTSSTSSSTPACTRPQRAAPPAGPTTPPPSASSSAARSSCSTCPSSATSSGSTSCVGLKRHPLPSRKRRPPCLCAHPLTCLPPCPRRSIQLMNVFSGAIWSPFLHLSA